MAHYVPAAKMNGLGNAILIMDMRRAAETGAGAAAKLRPEFIRLLGQNPETAFDQIMALYDNERHGGESGGALFRADIWNKDGSEAKACGNGSRCLAEYLWRQSGAAARLCFATKGGMVTAEKTADGAVCVTMGRPDFTPQALPLGFTPKNMDSAPLAQLLPGSAAAQGAFSRFPQRAALLALGNPHAVFFLTDAPRGAIMPLAAYPLAEFGAALERSPAFPQGVNVSLAKVEAPDAVSLRVWERGAGLTQACGTAACATAIAAYRRGLTKAAIAVALPGGALHVSFKGGICRMSGATEFEYGGAIDLESGAFRRAA